MKNLLLLLVTITLFTFSSVEAQTAEIRTMFVDVWEEIIVEEGLENELGVSIYNRDTDPYASTLLITTSAVTNEYTAASFFHGMNSEEDMTSHLFYELGFSSICFSGTTVCYNNNGVKTIVDKYSKYKGSYSAFERNKL